MFFVINLCNMIGFAPFLEKKFPLQQAQELAELIKLSTQNKLNNVDIHRYYEKFTDKEKEILDPFNLDQNIYLVKTPEQKLKEEEDRKK